MFYLKKEISTKELSKSEFNKKFFVLFSLSELKKIKINKLSFKTVVKMLINVFFLILIVGFVSFNLVLVSF